jgi:hypothetical protein
MLREKLVGSEKLDGKEKLQRILELTYKGLNESKEDKKNDSDFLVKEGVDGKNYAIVKEMSHYFIKVSDNKENLLKEDFNYMGGVVYNTKYKYNSFADAVKGLNTFLYTLKESLNIKKDYVILENDRFVLRQPEPAQPTPAPQPPVQNEPQPEMTTSEPQMDGQEVEPQDGGFEDDEDSVIRQVQRLTGKLGQKIRDSYNSKEGFDDKMVKYVMNSVISAIKFENVNPQVKETLIGRINQVPNEEVPQEQPMDTLQPQNPQPEPQMEENDLMDKVIKKSERKKVTKTTLFNLLDENNLSNEQLNNLEFLSNLIDDILDKEFDFVADNPKDLAKEYMNRKEITENIMDEGGFNEHDVVNTPKGSGTIVHVYDGGEYFEVEIMENGVTQSVDTFSKDELSKIEEETITENRTEDDDNISLYSTNELNSMLRRIDSEKWCPFTREEIETELESRNIKESKGLPKITIGGKSFLFEDYFSKKKS